MSPFQTSRIPAQVGIQFHAPIWTSARAGALNISVTGGAR